MKQFKRRTFEFTIFSVAFLPFVKTNPSTELYKFSNKKYDIFKSNFAASLAIFMKIPSRPLKHI